MEAQNKTQILDNQLILQKVKLLWAKQQLSGQTSSASGTICCFLPFLPRLRSAVGGRGKLALLLLLSPAPFACCSAKTPSAGNKRGQKYICSVMEEQNSTWSGGSAEQRCTEAQSYSLHSRTLPATTELQELHPVPPPLCPARRESPAPTMISLSVLRSGPSHCITSHLHFSLWPSATTMLKH